MAGCGESASVERGREQARSSSSAEGCEVSLSLVLGSGSTLTSFSSSECTASGLSTASIEGLDDTLVFRDGRKKLLLTVIALQVREVDRAGFAELPRPQTSQLFLLVAIVRMRQESNLSLSARFGKRAIGRREKRNEASTIGQRLLQENSDNLESTPKLNPWMYQRAWLSCQSVTSRRVSTCKRPRAAVCEGSEKLHDATEAWIS